MGGAGGEWRCVVHPAHTSPSTALLASCTMRPVILWAVVVCSYSTGPASYLSVAFVVSKPLSQAPFGRGSVARGFPPLGFCRQGSPSPLVGLTLGSDRRKDWFCGVAAGVCVWLVRVCVRLCLCLVRVVVRVCWFLCLCCRALACARSPCMPMNTVAVIG